MSAQNGGFVPNDSQKLAILRGMILSSTGHYPNDKLVLPVSILRPDVPMSAEDDPDEHTLVYSDDGGSWDDDADDDDDVDDN